VNGAQRVISGGSAGFLEAITSFDAGRCNEIQPCWMIEKKPVIDDAPNGLPPGVWLDFSQPS
jgi:hypothetical protein